MNFSRGRELPRGRNARVRRLLQANDAGFIERGGSAFFKRSAPGNSTGLGKMN
jgi:hypothetical protein